MADGQTELAVGDPAPTRMPRPPRVRTRPNGADKAPRVAATAPKTKAPRKRKAKRRYRRRAQATTFMQTIAELGALVKLARALRR